MAHDRHGSRRQATRKGKTDDLGVKGRDGVPVVVGWWWWMVVVVVVVVVVPGWWWWIRGGGRLTMWRERAQVLGISW